MKIGPVGAGLFHAGREADMTEVIFAVCSSANEPNKASRQSPQIPYEVC